MTNLENAAHQALKALENPLAHGAVRLEKVIAALREALEQEQEPVAWMYSDAQGRTTLVKSNVAPYEDATPLYAEPPKREWVGLTDVEIGDALIDLPVFGNGYFLRIARAIESKLKDKNGV